MTQLTDRTIKNLEAPASGNRIYYDDQITGFGLRVTKSGAKAFILNFRIHGRERRMTLGSYPAWTLLRARKRASELRRMIDNGIDPLEARQEAQKAPTIADLAERFIEEHFPKYRPSTRRDNKRYLEKDILPDLKHRKVADIRYVDIDGLHRKISKRGSTYAANRAVALLSKMFALAIKWGWCSDNPAKGIDRNQEAKRHRYLNGDELARLSAALADHEDEQAANIIRLLLLTGARRGEVQAMEWSQLDLDRGIWTKPASLTKQKALHRAPLSDAACQLLRELRANAEADAKYIFPGRHDGHRVEIKGNWAAICKAAGIEDVRIHDLRHTYASILASAGLGLPLIGALLGHSQPATTARYAHLFDDPLRAATQRAADIITGKPSAEIVPIKKNTVS